MYCCSQNTLFWLNVELWKLALGFLFSEISAFFVFFTYFSGQCFRVLFPTERTGRESFSFYSPQNKTHEHGGK